MRIRNLLALALLWVLLGCGQTGDLYLPGTEVETVDELPVDPDDTDNEEQSK